MLRTLPQLRMLDACDTRIDYTGNTGTRYFSQRLLSKDVTLSPRLDNIRWIALRLALEDGNDNIDDSESYTKYIDKLSFLLIKQGNLSFQSLFGPDERAPHTGILRYDYLSAVSYTGHLSLVRELCQAPENTVVQVGTLGCPYTAAALGGHIAIIDFLLDIADSHGRGATGILTSQMLYTASQAGSLHTIQHLLASKWKPRLWYPKGTRMRASNIDTFHSAMITPNVKILDALLAFKAASSSPDKTLSQQQLAETLRECCARGHTEVAAYLIDLGASIEGAEGAYPLPVCEQAGIMSLVLQRSKESVNTGFELIKAIKMGRLDVVKVLVEDGTSTSRLMPESIVSAVELEDDRMFRFLVEHCALTAGDAGKGAMAKAKEQGNHSMVSLLWEHGVGVHVE